MSERFVFITGAAGGLGGRTARHLAERSWRVFAADFDADALEELADDDRIVPVPLDVTDPVSIDAARRTVDDAGGGLDGIVNFAGILAVGSLVEIDEATLRRVLDVNVMGTFRVNRALFPCVLARKGRIVNISSETGWQSGMPFNGPYAMSKHAIEAYSDSLRRELMFLDVPVIKIQPGPFKTEMVTGIERSFTRAAETSQHFGEVIRRLLHLALNEQKKAQDPSLIAEVIHRALTVAHPRPAYSVKPDLGRRVLNWLPPRWADVLIRRAL